MKKEDKEIRVDEAIEKKIFDTAENIEVPESLKPEKIEEILFEKQKQKGSRWKRSYTVSTVAACCAVLIGAAMYGGMFQQKQSEETLVQNEGAKESSQDKKDASPEKKTVVAQIASAKDYEEIYEYIKVEAETSNQGAVTESYGMTESAADSAMVKSAVDGAVTGNTNYADTNIRAEGVGEADIVKTDGKHLYITNGQKVQIVNIEEKAMKEMASIRLEKDQYISEIYVKDERLIVVYTKTEYEEASVQYGGNYRQYTVAETYDVSEPQKPISIGKITQSGSYYTLRVNGEYVYLLSNFYADTNAKQTDIAAYIPEVQGSGIDSAKILLPQYQRGNQYTVISGFSIYDPEGKIDSKAVFGGSGQVYISGNNIYLCELYYNSEESDVTQTCIRKISYKNGSVEAVGQTKIKGTLNDSFSIDEYEGNLRVVTTISYTGNNTAYPIMRINDDTTVDNTNQKDTNALYVLDESLNEIGKIEGLAEDESVYSARFIGEVGYFVTYKQVDPLFSVDLSDPKNPQIIGELKISGFSEYLHAYGEGLLLGVGMESDETGMTTTGVKLSMFDISNPAQVKEIQKKILEGFYSTDVAYNYKAALIDPEKNLISFAAYGDGQHYYVFSYDKESGFSCELDRETSGTANIRGMYVGDTFYIVSGNTVESFEMDSFQKVDDIVL